MFKKMLFATAAAGLLAVAALPTAASAADNWNHPGWHQPGGDDNGPDWGNGRDRRAWGNPGDSGGYDCGPRTVKWWDQWGNPHWSTVSKRCPTPPPAHWSGGGGYGWNGGGWHRPRPWGGWSFGFSFDGR